MLNIGLRIYVINKVLNDLSKKTSVYTLKELYENKIPILKNLTLYKHRLKLSKIRKMIIKLSNKSKYFNFLKIIYNINLKFKKNAKKNFKYRKI